MTMDEKYPVLFGYREDNERTELHGINEVAKYICREGLYSDLKIITESDQLLANTIGIYLDKVYDIEYRDELVKVLVPMQHEVERTYLSGETADDKTEREINEYLESEEYEIDLAVEVRWYQEEGVKVPSIDFIESVLVKRKREQLEKEMECENCGMTDHIQCM